jgi:hypothetical protein
VALILVAVGAILVWFLIAPFLKPSPVTTPADFDPRVTCTLCDELRDPADVIEREFGAGRYQFICAGCLASMVQDFQTQHGRMPEASAPPSS